MGSFPNTTAAKILGTLFTPAPNIISASPTLYGNSNSTGNGLDGGGAAGASVTLYVGLIAGGNATNPIPNNTAAATLQNILTDNAILGGTTNAPINTAAGGPGAVYGLTEYSVAGNNMARQAITFTLTNTGDTGGSTAQPVATIQGPTAAAGVSFAGAGGANPAQATTASVIGFFISTRLTAAGGGAVPNVIAYGNLSSSRTINSGDNPTFAQNAITITLD